MTPPIESVRRPPRADAIAFDRSDATAATSRFVIVDGYEISAGGIVREALPERQGGFA